MAPKPEIIYFGGTFDPVHKGHMDAVRIAQTSFPGSKIVLVPSLVPPVSATAKKKVSTEFVDRIAMAVIAFDEWPGVEVSSVEEDLPAPNYTVATLEALKTANPGASIAWMIGADQLLQFTTWKNPRRILELSSLVVLPRPAMCRQELLDSAKNLVSGLGFASSCDKEARRLDLNGAGSIYILDEAPQSESSGEIRELASKNVKELQGRVAPAVIEYIVDLELYQ